MDCNKQGRCGYSDWMRLVVVVEVDTVDIVDIDQSGMKSESECLYFIFDWSNMNDIGE